MKMSVSLPVEDVEFLDTYARDHDIGSRSAAVQRAVELLRTSELGDAYADAWREWNESGAALDWEPTTADGLTH
ncbi:ribbon-helix-helix domain-containing protein [Saccharomonospora sp. NPDC046836]|uniref:ribbon-helix-helix domain-containing protein n=1 Tax=Saccharomonospora sp. NPDC046836 TaxID=3156921 RepID=UPI0033E448E1